MTSNVSLIEKASKRISKVRVEHKHVKKFRAKALQELSISPLPAWSFFTLPEPSFRNQTFFSIPRLSRYKKEALRNIIKALSKPKPKNKNERFSPSLVLDTVVGSMSIYSPQNFTLIKQGVIFSSFSEALTDNPYLVHRYLGSLVSPSDNYFSCLNSILFSDGSYAYIPEYTSCPVELSTFFRVQDTKAGQFERTLIVVETHSRAHYTEGCSAITSEISPLHAAVVELFSGNKSSIFYFTIQNWYTGSQEGRGGVLNLVTKRALCSGFNSYVKWTQIEVGAAITWKYPGTILLGLLSVSEFFSITLTKSFQRSDTGTKMVHVGAETTSNINSKSISAGHSENTYRSSVSMLERTNNSLNITKCDSFLLGNSSTTCTYPYISVKSPKSVAHHEAITSSIDKTKIFYLQQRGVSEEKSVIISVHSFCLNVTSVLPFEFGLEANMLLELELPYSIG